MTTEDEMTETERQKDMKKPIICHHAAFSEAEPTERAPQQRDHSHLATRYLCGTESPTERSSENVTEALGVSEQGCAQALSRGRSIAA